MAEKFDRGALKAMEDKASRYQAGMTEEAYDWLQRRGISREVADVYKLGISDDLHRGRLAIPYLRPAGVIWFNYRTLEAEGKPKYISHGSRHLYNTEAFEVADATGEVAIAEGELDAIVATALCGVPTVGIPGATQWQGNKHWHELFTGYQKVWVLADPDEAGKSLAEQVLGRLGRARLVQLPADVNDTYLKHGGIREFMT